MINMILFSIIRFNIKVIITIFNSSFLKMFLKFRYSTSNKFHSTNRFIRAYCFSHSFTKKTRNRFMSSLIFIFNFSTFFGIRDSPFFSRLYIFRFIRFITFFTSFNTIFTMVNPILFCIRKDFIFMRQIIFSTILFSIFSILMWHSSSFASQDSIGLKVKYVQDTTKKNIWTANISSWEEYKKFKNPNYKSKVNYFDEDYYKGLSGFIKITTGLAAIVCCIIDVSDERIISQTYIDPITHKNTTTKFSYKPDWMIHHTAITLLGSGLFISGLCTFNF